MLIHLCTVCGCFCENWMFATNIIWPVSLKYLLSRPLRKKLPIFVEPTLLRKFNLGLAMETQGTFSLVCISFPWQWEVYSYVWAGKGLYRQSYGFSSSHVLMWELDNKRGWVPKNWCLRIVVLEKTPESPLGSKDIKSVNPKGNQPWIFIGRTDAKLEAPILWPPDAKSQLIGKEPVVGKDWRQEEKGITEDEMAGWHHRLNEHEFEQTLVDSGGQGSLATFSPWSLTWQSD